MATIEYGSAREVWLATLADPTTKHSFIIRDDAFAKSGVSFGRTQRLGDPMNLGPGSGWQQMTWEGGKDQEAWDDKAMFFEGNADIKSRTGKFRLWPGWAAIQKEASRSIDSYTMARGGNTSLFDTIKLYFAERNFFSTSGAPSGGFKAYVYNPTTNVTTQLPTTVIALGTTGYTAICPATDDNSAAEFIYFGTLTGFWIYNVASNTFTQDLGAPGTNTVWWDSMVTFKDAVYYCSNKSLYKRTPLPPYGVQGTHTELKVHRAAYRTFGLCVHQNRLWYGIHYSGNRSAVGTSDGVTASQAFEFPEEFSLMGMTSHYGALYLFGFKPQAVPGSLTHPRAIAQVWKYSGSGLTKLWESNDSRNRAAIDGKPHIAHRGASFGSLLVWGHGGFAGTVEQRAGLMCYDADTDSIFNGPELPSDPAGRKDGLLVNGVVGWDNTLAISFHDLHDYSSQGAAGVTRPTGVAFLRMPDYVRHRMNYKNVHTFKGRSVEFQEPARVQYIRSSTYQGEADVIHEPKVWLSGRMTVRIPSKYCTIKVYAQTKEGYWVPPDGEGMGFPFEGDLPSANINTDGRASNGITSDGTPSKVHNDAAGRPEALAQSRLVKTITYDATEEGWRTVTFPIKYNGAYLSSTKFQYAVVLENNDPNVNSAESPEVDSVEIQWMVAPTKRMQWRYRFVLEDGQTRLDGVTPNPLTTAQALADKLQLFWSSRIPFLMYEANTGGGATGSPIEVLPPVDGFNVSQYRLDSGTTEVAQEVALTLIENVTT